MMRGQSFAASQHGRPDCPAKPEHLSRVVAQDDLHATLAMM